MSKVSQKSLGAVVSAQAGYNGGAKTSSAIYVKGYNLLTLQVVFTRSAGTGYSINLQGSLDDGSTYGEVQELDSSSPPTLTSGDALWSMTTSASDNIVWNIPLNYHYVKIVSDIAGSPNATADIITINAQLAVV